ncbi:MAG: hypothetical protein AAF845_02400 [Bacteroidota bacterium]
MILDAPPQPFVMEGGYSVDGAPAFSMYTAGTVRADPTREIVDEVWTVHLASGALSFEGAKGEALYGTSPGVGPSMASVGTQAEGPPDVAAGVVLHALPAPGTVTAVDGGTLRVTSVTTGSGGRRTIHERASFTGAGERATTQRRTYRREGPYYILERVETDIDEGDASFRMYGQNVVTVSNVVWFENPPFDLLREQQQGGWGTPDTSAEPYEPPLCSPLENPDEECDEPPPGGGPPGGSPPGGGNPPAPCATVSGGANVIYAHGINSSGDTWGSATATNRVRGRARCGMEIAAEAAPTYGNGGFDSHTAQEAELDSYVRGLYRDQNILVAHSQGGLISRRVAQNFEAAGDDDLVRGVVTIGTPHQGAFIAENSPRHGLTVVRDALGRGIVCRFVQGACSYPVQVLNSTLDAVLWYNSGRGSDAIDDLRPGSNAIRAVNGVTETFPRYGIQHYVDKRWSFARVGADALIVNGGPYAVAVLDVTYWGAIGVTVGSVFFGNWGLAIRAGRFAYQLKSTDRWYNRITSYGDQSDGVVQGQSQVYPRAIRNFQAVNPTSHTGETRTERSYVEVERVLTDELGVQPRD